MCQHCAGQTERKFMKVLEIIEKHEHNPAKLIPILQEVQEEYRYLPEEVMTFLATSLGLSPAKVYGVATFFSHFALKPKGKHIIKVCDGTACHVKRSQDIIDVIYQRLGLTAKKNTTEDMLFTLEVVSCLGACGLAPVVVIDEEVHGQMTAASTLALINEICTQEEVKV